MIRTFILTDLRCPDSLILKNSGRVRVTVVARSNYDVVKGIWSEFLREILNDSFELCSPRHELS